MRSAGAIVSAILFVGALSGCASSPPAHESGFCVPLVDVHLTSTTPGSTIPVEVVPGCDVPTPEGGWTLVAAPVGNTKAAVRVHVDERLVKGFTWGIDLPADFPLGEAYAGIEGWNYSGCDDTGSCASPTASFTVTAPAPEPTPSG